MESLHSAQKLHGSFRGSRVQRLHSTQRSETKGSVRGQTQKEGELDKIRNLHCRILVQTPSVEFAISFGVKERYGEALLDKILL